MSTLIRSPLPSLISDAHFYISGNVTVHPSAVIAPGVLLQADPGSELVVAAGVCIGAGSVIHAHQGRLEVETGATLGSTVLIVGQGKIGANACIGSMTTIFNSSVLPQQIVPPGSLIGDGSRQVIVIEPAETESRETKPTAAESPEVKSPEAKSPEAKSPEATTAQSPSPPSPAARSSESPSADSAGSVSSSGEVQVVYGRAYLERMMLTMFPYRQSTQESKDEG